VKFRIWRGVNSGSLSLIDSVAASINAYTDLTPPAGILYYAIEAVSTVQCNPSLKIQGVYSTYSSALSNIPNTNNSSVNEMNEEISVSIYPNPANDVIGIEFERSITCQMQLIDLIGSEIKNEKMFALKTQMNVRDVKDGIYFVQIKTEQGIIAKKIVVQH
jgi:hypothetical protein